MDPSRNFFEGKLVLVAGGTGMVGSYLVIHLLNLGAHVRIPIHIRPLTIKHNRVETVKANLLQMEDCLRVTKGVDIVCNAAAVVGGVLRNKLQPAEIYTINMLLHTQLLEASRINDVERFLLVSNNGVYPPMTRPSREEEAWDGKPDESVQAYGWVKRMAEFQAAMYAKQYGIKIAIGRGTNSYGNWDNFDPDTSHVIPALIRKAVCRCDPFVIWGTGENVRDFIHASDLARGMLLLVEKYAVCDPVNLATGKPVTIKKLAELILKIAGHKANIIFDYTKPGGQPIKLIDTSKAKRLFNFEPRVSLEDGLRQTIAWFKENYSV
jgi:GDP-L-fucose synthase